MKWFVYSFLFIASVFASYIFYTIQEPEASFLFAFLAAMIGMIAYGNYTIRKILKD